MGADRPGSLLFPSTSPAQTPRPHGTLGVVRRSGLAAAAARGRQPMTTRRRGHRATLAHRRKVGKCQRLQRLTMRQMMRHLARHRRRWAPDRANMVRQERQWNAVQDPCLARRRRQRLVRADRLDGGVANRQARPRVHRLDSHDPIRRGNLSAGLPPRAICVEGARSGSVPRSASIVRWSDDVVRATGAACGAKEIVTWGLRRRFLWRLLLHRQDGSTHQPEAQARKSVPNPACASGRYIHFRPWRDGNAGQPAPV